MAQPIPKSRGLQELRENRIAWVAEKSRLLGKGEKHRPRHRPKPPGDWLDKLWAVDNHRDPEQHAEVLRLQGRHVTKRQGYQDYFRQQRRQRNSKHRALDLEPTTDPNTVVDKVVDKVTAEHVLDSVNPKQALALHLVCGLDLSITEAATEMHLSDRQMRYLVKTALQTALGNFSRLPEFVSKFSEQERLVMLAQERVTEPPW